MRNHVTFRHPAQFVPLSDEDGILAVSGADWFATLLRKLPGFDLDEELCQEDWGVVFFGRRNQRKYWIGLSAWGSEGTWNAHFHHGSFAWFQRFSKSAQIEFARLLSDAHTVLKAEAMFSDIAWYEECEMSNPRPASFSVPIDD